MKNLIVGVVMFDIKTIVVDVVCKTAMKIMAKGAMEKAIKEEGPMPKNMTKTLEWLQTR